MFEGKEVKVFLANAGSGKTSRLMRVVGDELKTRRPEEIAFVTFTRKGASEGLSRACSLYGYTPDDLPYFRTLHSLTFHALGLKGNQMFNKIHERRFNKEFGYELNRTTAIAQEYTRDSKYLDYYDLERTGALTSQIQAEADIELGYYDRLVHAYEEYKAQCALVDFFDCLVNYARDGSSLPVRVALIDECQDISYIQWKVIEKAFANAEKIYIAGDDSQSLYQYNGARPDILIEFSKIFPVEYLAKSYRIPKKVYELAKGIMDFIYEKTDKPFEFREGNAEGNILQISSTDRLKNFLVPVMHNNESAEWFLLARNKCYLDRYTSILEENLIPYWNCDGFFMGGEIMKRLNKYYNFRKLGYGNEKKKQDFADMYGITDFSAPFTDYNLFDDKRKWIYEAYIEKYGLRKLEEMCNWRPQILVSSIHFVKGGEARNVAILLDTTVNTKKSMFKNIDDELRVLYVGVTRTKENLFLVDSEGGDGFDSIIETIKDNEGLVW